MNGILKELLFWIFGIIAILICFFAVRSCINKKGKKFSVTHLQSLTIRTFFAGLALFVPISYSAYDFQIKFSIIRPLALAALGSAKAFILDSDYGIVLAATSGCSIILKIFYSLISLLFFILAPVLTAGFILSLFKNLSEDYKFRHLKNKSVYAVSCLNDKSLALAKSICNRHIENRKDIAIIFTGISRESESDIQKIKSISDNIQLICLEKDIADIDWTEKTGRLELFLINDDETLNIQHAVKLNEKLKNRMQTEIFVYATSVESGYIIDSLDKGNMIVDSRIKEKISTAKLIHDNQIEKNLDDICKESDIALKDTYEITRIDCVNNFVLDTFISSDIFKLSPNDQKVISIMIIGMGQYGKQILKTALWFCQMDGYKLEINVIDNSIESDCTKADIIDILKHECPEIISKNPSLADGDANYDIKFFTNTDCYSAKFDELFENSDYTERLSKTQVVFVALGDDDKNIETAITVRKNFSRLKINNGTCNELNETDIPIIYSIVFDDKKAENLNSNNTRHQLTNYCGTPFNIRFVGHLSKQYSYDTIMEYKAKEKAAFIYHINWAKIQMEFENDLRKDENTALLSEVLTEEDKTDIEDLYWSYKYLYNCDGYIEDELIKNIEKYLNFEYYREASVAKAIHKKVISDNFKNETTCSRYNNFLCTCENCERRRKTEHIRWIAYMRTKGYIGGNVRSDIGKVHTELRNWNDLYIRTKFKD